ncbi:hypothetical protein E2C01_028833 [Portunus trituberculatus]|uniref:Uncharacterized protein n=1 Tax=Portunus trituberculatus TaxID=210409 RepID=A0A5B7ELQ7_PORTR|nr:hypothetical protein [Portunus trituberculatus]
MESTESENSEDYLPVKSDTFPSIANDSPDASYRCETLHHSAVIGRLVSANNTYSESEMIVLTGRVGGETGK